MQCCSVDSVRVVVCVFVCVCVYEEECVCCAECVFEAELGFGELRIGGLRVEILIVEGSTIKDTVHVAVELLESIPSTTFQIPTHLPNSRSAEQRQKHTDQREEEQRKTGGRREEGGGRRERGKGRRGRWKGR